MTKRTLNPKKIEHTEKRHELAEDIVAIRNLKSFSEEKKGELINELLRHKKITEMKTRKDYAETMKAPKLEKENHKIDKGLSKKEKLAQWWKEEERRAYINGTKIKIKVLKKELAKGAFVREYQDDGKMPSHLIGEQLFNWKAVLNLWLQNKLPTWENMQTMRWETKEEKDNFLKNNFQKDWKNMFPACWHPDYKGFGNIGGRMDCWLLDGYNVALNEDIMNHNNNSPEFGFSLRLLQN